VRIVAIAAALIVLIDLERLSAMALSPQLGKHRVMAAGASPGMEETFGGPVDVGRIGMRPLFSDIAVAVQTHDLAVGRNMPARLVHQPICVGRTAHAK
jgi:hypothetical protein